MKSKIIEAMMTDSASAHMSRVSAEAAFDTVFRAVKTVTMRDKTARVPDFGTFKLVHQEGRQARNPRTGETVQTSARDVMKFRQSKPAK